MFKNKNVILSSIAIIFTLVLCAIFVNFTLANSAETTSSDSGATSGSTSSIVGETNIDLAIENSNNSSLAGTGKDKFNIVQILPEGMEDYVTNEATLTEKVTADGYTGTVAKEELFNSTTSLWKYVYDRELMKYAVFENYKTIEDEMAEGAVQLTSVTVSDLNGMNSTAQTLLSNADLIYIAATSASDYASTSKDISEDLYSFLGEYATSDNKPLIIDSGALCTDPSNISGNNDTYRMGALAYKVMTSSLSSRYSNVLVSTWDYFAELYTEASGNYTINEVTNANKTISDFILAAENDAASGGKNYLYGGYPYYKWYIDGDGTDGSTKESLATFFGRNSSYTDSSYVKVVYSSSSSSGTESVDSWEFDNAKVLIITNGESSSIQNALDAANETSMNSSVYSYNESSQTWSSKTSSSLVNSDFTGTAYTSDIKGMQIPGGADLYVISTTDENLKKAAEGTAVTLDNVLLSDSYYEDFTTTSVSGTVVSNTELETSNITVYLLATDSENSTYLVGNFTYGSSTNLSSAYTTTLTNANGTGSYSYSYSFTQLDTGAYYIDTATGEIKDDLDGYTYTPVFVVNDSEYSYYLLDDNNNLKEAETSDTKYNIVKGFVEESNTDNVKNLHIDSEDDAAAFVSALHTEYSSYVNNTLKSSFTIDSFSDYDFVFIESGEHIDEIDTTAYNMLCAAVEAGTYVIVSGNAGNGVGSSGSDVSTSGGVSVVSPSAKAIADIINAGTYRDGNDNKFRVLEIQPDYPIDTELAESSSTTNSGYSTHSDGTSVKGSYYTVPSDVVEGSAKEELDEDTEYYDFDLTKAKIAYAIDGVSYSDIELTQVSTEALIGMSEDISATYDLVYIGGDISALDKSIEETYKYGSNKDDLNDGTWKYLSSVIPTFIMYYHTGVLWEVYNDGSGKLGVSSAFMVAGINGGTTKVFAAENGNDLTTTKYDELVSYINSGRPIMISDELTSVYENMNGIGYDVEKLSMVQLLSGYWYENGQLTKENYYLDPSSQMYKLVDYVYTTYDKQKDSSSNNILWGVDTSDEKMIANSNQKYGITLYTYYNGKSYLDADVKDSASWYGEDGTIQLYAVVFGEDTNEEISDLVSKSSSRARLKLTSSPVSYQEGNSSTYLSTTNLSFTFGVTADSGTYSYTIWVDSNKNSQFDDSDKSDGYYYAEGSVSSGDEKTVNVALESDYFGSAYWRIQIMDSKGNVVSEKTGVSKIVNNTEEKSEINVLQINTGINSTQGSQSFSDTLYFDIRSQMAHDILYYNANISNSFSSSAGNTYTEEESLGRHEYRFGIVEYDTSATDDDWYSNLADDLTEDYDINLDIAVAETQYLSSNFTSNNLYDSIEQWAIEADALEANNGTGKYDGYTMAEYEKMADDAFEEYCTLIETTNTAKTDIDAFLNDVITYVGGSTPSVTSTSDIQTFMNQLKVSGSNLTKLCQNAIDNEEYYLIFTSPFSKDSINISSFGTFGDLFVAYRNAKDTELDKRDEYRTYLRRSYGGDFLSEMYSIIIIGPSQDFGGNEVDLSESACSYLIKYIEAGGDVFFFHDTMTPFYSAGSVNLTTSLLDIVGMNRFHVDMTNQSNSYASDVTTVTATEEGLVTATAKAGDTIYCQSWSDITSDGWTKLDSSVSMYCIDLGYNIGYGYLYSKVVTEETSGYYIYVNTGDTYEVKSSGEYTPTATGYGGTSSSYSAYVDSTYYLTPYANNLSSIMETADIAESNEANATTAGVSLSGNNYKLTSLFSSYSISAVAMTPLYFSEEKYGSYFPYIYATTSSANLRSTQNDSSGDPSTYAQTARAARLNEGLVTMYPFSISDTMYTGGTHQQAYALDLENENTTVWYTLAGSNNGWANSSFYAADPYDAMESYFIYTTAYGDAAITYCGAGHTSITGLKAKNNDERKLFINVIVNSADAVKSKPKLKLYDYEESELTTELEKDTEASSSTGKTIYSIDADSKTSTVSFDIGVTIPDDVTVRSIKIYFDLNWTEDTSRPTYDSTKDVLIWSSGDGVIATSDIYSLLKQFSSTNELWAYSLKGIKLQDSYFTYTGNNYTYIVVEVYYNNSTTPVYAIIKIKVSDPLFELTEGTYSINLTLDDAIGEEKFKL